MVVEVQMIGRAAAAVDARYTFPGTELRCPWTTRRSGSRQREGESGKIDLPNTTVQDAVPLSMVVNAHAVPRLAEDGVAALPPFTCFDDAPAANENVAPVPPWSRSTLVVRRKVERSLLTP